VRYRHAIGRSIKSRKIGATTSRLGGNVEDWNKVAAPSGTILGLSR
jgi:hypothetical protein